MPSVDSVDAAVSYSTRNTALQNEIRQKTRQSVSSIM